MVFLVVVVVVDMDDLEVIRFLAMDIITENSLPCFSAGEKPYFVPLLLISANHFKLTRHTAYFGGK